MLRPLAGHPTQKDLGLIAGERWLVDWLLGGDQRSLFAVYRTRGILAAGMGQSNVEIVRRGRLSGAEVAFTRMAGVMTIDDGRIVRAVWLPHRDRALEAVELGSG
jgi:hypothetical protein